MKVIESFSESVKQVLINKYLRIPYRCDEVEFVNVNNKLR